MRSVPPVSRVVVRHTHSPSLRQIVVHLSLNAVGGESVPQADFRLQAAKLRFDLGELPIGSDDPQQVPPVHMAGA